MDASMDHRRRPARRSTARWLRGRDEAGSLCSIRRSRSTAVAETCTPVPYAFPGPEERSLHVPRLQKVRPCRRKLSMLLATALASLVRTRQLVTV